MFHKIKNILIISMIMIITIIFYQNTEDMQFKILFWEKSMPKIVWFLLLTVVGIIIGRFLRIRKKSKDDEEESKEESKEDKKKKKKDKKN